MVASGDEVGFDLLMAGHGQVREGDTFADTNFEFETLYNLSACPLRTPGRSGDTLKVNVLEVTPATGAGA